MVKLAAMRVVSWPDPVLSKKCKPFVFEPGSDKLKNLIEDLTNIQKALRGVGIAANQIGIDTSVCLCWFNSRSPEDLIPMVNPEIVAFGGPWIDMQEGCLSCNGVVCTVRRRKTVTVKWQDVNGFEQTETYSDWNARIVQHELDHLNGKVIIDRINTVDKLANRNAIEHLQFNKGVIPDRLKGKMSLKHSENGNYYFVRH